ncbi:g10406 [Coccomyxa elongata]
MGPPHALITRLPFVTTFGTGSGTAVHHLGAVMAAKPWFNLSMQTVQPLFQVAERIRVELAVNARRIAVRLSTLHAAVSPNSAFEGGCCLRIQASLHPEGSGISVELYKAHFEVPAQGLRLVCALQGLHSARLAIGLCTEDGHSLELTDDAGIDVNKFPSLSSRVGDQWRLRRSRTSMNLKLSTMIGSIWLHCTPLPDNSVHAQQFAGAIGMLQILPTDFAAPREPVRDLAASSVCLTAPPSCTSSGCNSSTAEQRLSDFLFHKAACS